MALTTADERFGTGTPRPPIFSDIFDMYLPGECFRAQALVNQLPCISHLSRKQQKILMLEANRLVRFYST